MKSRFLPFFFAWVLATSLDAQDIAPELLPMATKYRADIAALNTQKQEAMKRVAEVYAAALDTAEKAETTAGRVAAIAAITQERGDLKKGELKTEFPNDLPKGLRTARKSYLDGVAHVTDDLGQRQQRLTADYLRSLANLQTRTGGNPALARQIADEKERALKTAGGTAEITRLFADSKWNNIAGGSGNIMLHADGSVSSTWGGKGKWKVLSPTRFELLWDNVKPQIWAIDPNAKILSLEATRWERQ